MEKMKLFFSALLVLVATNVALAQSGKVTGVVKDLSTGEPIPFASVMEKGTMNGVSADVDGVYVIRIADMSKAVLVASSVGYKNLEFAVAGRESISVELPVDNKLEEAILVGYGSKKKLGSIVGSVSVVGQETLKNTPTANISDALQGQVAGLAVASASGDPSEIASFRVRGNNSINTSTTPLFILDGTPVGSGIFNALNPNDIESMTVLKDAASTSIYGSRAANGVIVISTKKGKLNEKSHITLRGTYGFSQIAHDGMSMMNSNQYIKFRDMLGAPVSDEIKNLVEKYGISTNWRDEVFDSHAPTYNLDASVRGGSERLAYFISVNHMEQEGIIAQSGTRRESVRFNFDSKVNSWLKIGLSSNIAYQKYRQNNEAQAAHKGIYGSNPTVFARKAMPFDSPYYYTIDEKGDIHYGDKAEYLHYSGMFHPSYVNNHRSVVRENLSGNLNLYEQITPIKGLIIRSQQSLDGSDYTVHNVGFVRPDFESPMGDKKKGEAGYHQENFSRDFTFTSNNTIEYKFDINRHSATFLLGHESIVSNDQGFGVWTEGHTDNRMLRLSQGTVVTMRDVTDRKEESVMNSFFVTGNYSFAQKYNVDLSFRRDGSSKFAPGHRWANFYSVGAMWNLKKENWLKEVSWLDELSLKGSYGTTGNSGIGNYAYLGLLGSGNNYNGNASLGLSQPSNYDLKWESVASANIGLYASFFNRFNFEVDLYHKTTSDMILEIPYSMTTGYSLGVGNVGEMVNKGIDLNVSVDLVKTRSVLWNFRANFNYNKNEITKLFNGLNEFSIPDTGLKYTVGHSPTEFAAVRRHGVDPRDGKLVWLDKDGNLTKRFNEERDAVLTGKDCISPFTGGFSTSVVWKGLSFSADFAWAGKKYMYNNDKFFLENAAFATEWNQSTKMLEMWTEPGQKTDIPRRDENIQFDDYFLEDASFLRLKNVTLQYSLPQSLLRKTKVIDKLSVFATGRNLLTFTKYSGYDPEAETNIGKFFYPNTKQFVFGLEISF